MALLLMEFLTGVEGDRYQEVQGGQITRWFNLDGSEFVIPDNNGAGVSYTLKDANPPIPEWYNDPSAS